MTDRRRRARTRRASLLVAAAATVVIGVGACGSAPTPNTPTPVRADVVGPAEITASAQRSPLPAGTPGVGTPAVTIGTKDFGEQWLLGELYAQALRAKGFTVALQQNLGDTEIIDSAFAANQIDLYPEYVGEITSTLAEAPGGSALDSYRQAQAFEQRSRAATLLDQTPYQDTDVLVVRKELAEREGLRTVADLARMGSGGADVRVAAQPPFRTRTSGLAGMAQTYGLTEVQFLAVSPDETYGALQAGQAQVADGFSTDPELSSTDYVELDDTQNIFGFEYVAPVVKQAALGRSGPAFAQTLDWVSSLLTVDAIRSMNQQVQLDGADEATVAHDFLAAHGLQ